MFSDMEIKSNVIHVFVHHVKITICLPHAMMRVSGRKAKEPPLKSSHSRDRK